MKDNEIIKALECCCYSGDCEQCPYEDMGKSCKFKSTKDALELIKRQKLVIEELTRHHKATLKNLEEAHLDIKEKAAEIERLLTENRSFAIVQEGFKDMYKIAKAEAIKEFAERLDDTKIKIGNDYVVYADNIPVIKKEMVGEK